MRIYNQSQVSGRIVFSNSSGYEAVNNYEQLFGEEPGWTDIFSVTDTDTAETAAYWVAAYTRLDDATILREMTKAYTDYTALFFKEPAFQIASSTANPGYLWTE